MNCSERGVVSHSLDLIARDCRPPELLVYDPDSEYDDVQECRLYFEGRDRLSAAVDDELGLRHECLSFLSADALAWYLPAFTINCILFPESDLRCYLVFSLGKRLKDYITRQTPDDLRDVRRTVVLAFCSWMSSLDEGLDTYSVLRKLDQMA